MLQPTDIRINRQKMGSYPRDRVVEGGNLVFSWALETDRPEAGQTACRVVVYNELYDELYDSGWIERRKQEHHLTESGWPRGVPLHVRVYLRDELEREGESGLIQFHLGDVEWKALWISASEDAGEAAIYLRKEFFLQKPVLHATLYACGLGYHKLSVNGREVDNSLLDPACTDYTRVCQYAVIPDVQNLLEPGENFINVTLGGGWRRTLITSGDGNKTRFYGKNS